MQTTRKSYTIKTRVRFIIIGIFISAIHLKPNWLRNITAQFAGDRKWEITIICSHACNAYPHLALDREKDLTTLYYIHRYFNSWFDVGRNTFAWVVSPFSKEDIEKLKQETVDFGKFWNQIKEREDFQNLVDYVYEHRLDDKGTKEDIIKDYKKWVWEAVCMSNKGHKNK